MSLQTPSRKFSFSAVHPGARASQYETALLWLQDAGQVHKVHRVREVRPPLKLCEEQGAFRLFVIDCGLLGAMADVSPKMSVEASEAFEAAKAMFTMQLVAQTLIGRGLRPRYWARVNSSGRLDFVLDIEGAAIPMEVSAETAVRSQALCAFIAEHPKWKGLATFFRRL